MAKPTYGGYTYPDWAIGKTFGNFTHKSTIQMLLNQIKFKVAAQVIRHLSSGFGWLTAIISLVPLPVLALYELIRQKGTLKQVTIIITDCACEKDVKQWCSNITPKALLLGFRILKSNGNDVKFLLIFQRLIKSLQPASDWGPALPKYRQLYKYGKYDEKVSHLTKECFSDLQNLSEDHKV